MSSLKENKMGTMPVGRLLFQMALPMAISMLVQALYNVVDSVFVSNISDANQDALNAVSLAFPVQNIMIGLATGISVGVNALLSRALGEKDQQAVNRYAFNGLFLAFISMLLSALFGIFCAEAFMRSQTHNEAVIAYGTQYIKIITLLSFGVFGEVFFERLLQSTGRTIYTMFTQGAGAIINIILDPLLIFGIGFFPRMEVAGAAVATVIGQIVAFILAVILNQRKNPDVQLSLRGARPDRHMIGQILGVAIPSVIMVAVGSVMYYLFNQVLMRFEAVELGLGETGTAVFGAYFKLQSFIFMPVFGVNNATLAIVAYNYGARKPERILKAVKCGAVGACSLMAIGMALFLLLPEFLLSFFNANQTMLDVGVPALQTLCLPFAFAGVCIVFGGAFQGLGKSVYSLIVSVARQLVVLIPAAYLLSMTDSIRAVWFAFPIAEIMSLIVSLIMFITLYRKKIKPLYAQSEITT
ncbi:MAG: MATE family efflux transporter [Oscillospiraceae bacterium]|nr:MATE family efflux transporter [Oscillospiraceae bacterium]